MTTTRGNDGQGEFVTHVPERLRLTLAQLEREYARLAVREYGGKGEDYEEESKIMINNLATRLQESVEAMETLSLSISDFSYQYLVPLIEENRAIDPEWRKFYYVVYAHEPDDLSNRVHQRLVKGWKLVGQMAVVVTRTNVIPEQHGGGTYSDVKFFQAMERDRP